MYGLMSIFQDLGSLCHRLKQGEPSLGGHNVHLLSAVPPPIERKFRPLPSMQTSQTFSVLDSGNFYTPPLPSPSSNLPLEGVEIVKAAAFVGESALSSTQQYVLLSNSLQKPGATTFVLSTEPSPRLCADESENAGV